jgi:hypothetical protein
VAGCWAYVYEGSELCPRTQPKCWLKQRAAEGPVSLKCACTGVVAPPPTPPTPSPPKPANYQTASWVGSEYTPAAASNELWWAFWDDYKDAVRIELSAAQQVLGLTTVRMFLHNMVYDQASNSCASCFFVY